MEFSILQIKIIRSKRKMENPFQLRLKVNIEHSISLSPCTSIALCSVARAHFPRSWWILPYSECMYSVTHDNNNNKKFTEKLVVQCFAKAVLYQKNAGSMETIRKCISSEYFTNHSTFPFASLFSFHLGFPWKKVAVEWHFTGKHADKTRAKLVEE